MVTVQFALVTLSYGIAAIGYAVVALLVLGSRHGSRQSYFLAFALCVSAAWAAAQTWSLRQSLPAFESWLLESDALRSVAWLAFMAVLMIELVQGRVAKRIAAALLVAALVFAAVVAMSTHRPNALQMLGPQAGLLAMTGLPLLGILALEQVYRNAHLQHRRVLKPLATALGLIFGADILVFSVALLTNQASFGLLLLRGLIHAAAAPLMALATRRQLNWQEEFYVSREVVLYTTGLVGVMLYFAIMAITAFIVASGGVYWGVPAQIALFAIAVLALSYPMLSSTLRRKIKVFITKNFYRHRYDYRKEWLRLIETLVGRSEEAPLRERAVKALADIVGSTRGELWLLNSDDRLYEPHGSWGTAVPSEGIAPESPLAAYLAASHWVVDTREYLMKPELYSNAFAADEPLLQQASIFVPIIYRDQLLAIVRLDRPEGLGDLSFEDHDLLKTAGQQVAVFLVQERAQEELFETRQFEAFSKLTAFLMHDLKNVIAQQNLVVANAGRFKHRPEFVDDAIATIASSVDRMRRILERLQSSTRVEKSSRIDLASLVRDVCHDCRDRQPQPSFSADSSGLVVEMDKDRLNMAITHLVRNGQDATGADGSVHLRLFNDGKNAIIEVSDTGCGMEPEFVRSRLFRPFDSTKGAQGMGIGAFQIRETIRAAGGSVEVESRPGEGTTMRVKLPLSGRREAPLYETAM